MSKMWINPNADNTYQSKICPNCGQENDRYGLPIYPFNKSTKVLNWCTKCLSTVEDITTIDVELPRVSLYHLTRITSSTQDTRAEYSRYIVIADTS